MYALMSGFYKKGLVQQEHSSSSLGHSTILKAVLKSNGYWTGDIFQGPVTRQFVTSSLRQLSNRRADPEKLLRAQLF
jgi:hypothetical protein